MASELVQRRFYDDGAVAKIDLSPRRFDPDPLTRPVEFVKEQSAVFNSECSLNPLFEAAAPILAVANKITAQIDGIDPSCLHQRLIEEIRTFEHKARALDYRSPMISAARYFLCAYIDEVAESAPEAIKNLWQDQPLLKTIQGDSWGGRRFFSILERAMDDPHTYIHLLELAFLCLTLGYQGKYKKETHNAQELEYIRDNLFELITQIRGPHSSKLYCMHPHLAPRPASPDKKNTSRFHWITSSTLLVLGLLSVYWPYHVHLENMTGALAGAIESSLIADTPQHAGS